ncbi:hypothetical protein FKM82_011713 [Ascaphus truei]
MLLLHECGGELQNLHHLLPTLPSHAPGEAAQPRGGDPDAALDIHQVLPGSPLRGSPYCDALLYLRCHRHAGIERSQLNDSPK